MPSDLVARQAGPDKGSAKGIGLQNRSACHKVENRHVRAVTVRDQDPLEAVVGDALGDIQHEMQQVLLPDVDRPGEVHVMGLESVRDQRQQQDISVGALRSLLADAPDQEVVGIERKVMAVVLDRTDRQDDDRLLRDPGAKFLPGCGADRDTEPSA